MRTSLTEQEFKTWKAERPTREFFRYLRMAQEGLKEQWAQGNYNSEDPNITQAATFSARGEYHAYEELLDLDFEKLESALNGDDEEDQPVPGVGDDSGSE